MKAIFCALLFFVTADVCADTMTVGDLQQICTDASAESKSACKFYILGVAQGIRLGMSVADGKSDGGRLCLPDDVPSSGLAFLVKKNIGEILMFYPKDRALEASGFVGAALIKQYPCRPK